MKKLEKDNNKRKNYIKLLRQPLVLICIWIILGFILFKSRINFLYFILTPIIIIILCIWAIIHGSRMLKDRNNRFFGFINVTFGLIFIILLILIIYYIISVPFY